VQEGRARSTRRTMTIGKHAVGVLYDDGADFGLWSMVFPEHVDIRRVLRLSSGCSPFKSRSGASPSSQINDEIGQRFAEGISRCSWLYPQSAIRATMRGNGPLPACKHDWTWVNCCLGDAQGAGRLHGWSSLLSDSYKR
jgi:hypothetical protein